MPLYCYRWPGENYTHYSYVEYQDPTSLLEFLETLRSLKLCDGIEFWEIQKREDGYYPPKEGSGVEIWCFTAEKGQHLLRVA